MHCTSRPAVEPVAFGSDLDDPFDDGFNNDFETDINLPPDEIGFDAPFGASLQGDSDNLLANVKVVPDLTANALVIRATPQAFNLIEDTIRRLDRAPLQVLIEATIAEVVLNDLLALRRAVLLLETGSFAGGFNTSSPAGNTANNALLSPLAALARLQLHLHARQLEHHHRRAVAGHRRAGPLLAVAGRSGQQRSDPDRR